MQPRLLMVPVAALLVFGAYLIERTRPRTPERVVCSARPDFASFYEGRLARSRAAGARPGNEEKWVRHGAVTPVALLYVHGFGASRMEGEFVVDRLSRGFGWNTYYLRLPGHGTNAADHARTHFHEYLREAEESLCAVSALGNRVVLIGTSMGGLLATHLAATYPERVTALVLVSPFYDHGTSLARWVDRLPAPEVIARLYGGPIRKTGRRPDDPLDRRIPGFEAGWYTEQYPAAIRSAIELRHHVARPAVFRRVVAPTLLLYHYRTEEDQDRAASVPAMLAAFGEFGRARGGQPKNRAVALADGSHVMLSRFVRVDHGRVEAEIADFLGSVANPPKTR